MQTWAVAVWGVILRHNDPTICRNHRHQGCGSFPGREQAEIHRQVVGMTTLTRRQAKSSKYLIRRSGNLLLEPMVTFGLDNLQ